MHMKIGDVYRIFKGVRYSPTHVMYPIYQRGNPQLRVFLPNFWLKLVRPRHPQPENVVQFECSMEMNKYDIINYLKNIYDIPVVDVRTRISTGHIRKQLHKGYIIKDNDVRLAYAILPKDEKFVYPDIFVKTKESEFEDDAKSFDEMKKGFKTYLENNKNRAGLPSWYSF